MKKNRQNDPIDNIERIICSTDTKKNNVIK